jgi:hypothetical protein
LLQKKKKNSQNTIIRMYYIIVIYCLKYKFILKKNFHYQIYCYKKKIFLSPKPIVITKKLIELLLSSIRMTPVPGKQKQSKFFIIILVNVSYRTIYCWKKIFLKNKNKFLMKKKIRSVVKKISNIKKKLLNDLSLNC